MSSSPGSTWWSVPRRAETRPAPSRYRCQPGPRERWWEPELYRLRGELTLKQPGEQDPTSENLKAAEEYFLQAIKNARRIDAKSLELRATMSLGRLWLEQGKRAEAHRMLAEVYGWFTEGFETADLEEAKVLLKEAS